MDRSLFSVGKVFGTLSSSMAILDGDDEVGIDLDFAGQFVTHDFDQIIKDSRSVVVRGHSLVGEEHQRHHDQRHVISNDNRRCLKFNPTK